MHYSLTTLDYTVAKDSFSRPVTGMSINEGLGTTINIRVTEHCNLINLERKKI